MRRNLNRVVGYFEATIPTYSPSEFQIHFRLARASFEMLCPEVVNTWRIPLTNRGRERIPPEKQVLILKWTMANQEVLRLVADRFNITPSSINRVLKRCALALTELFANYLKWLDGKIMFKRNVNCHEVCNNDENVMIRVNSHLSLAVVCSALKIMIVK